MARLGVVPIFYKASIPYPWSKHYKFIFGNEYELRVLVDYIKKNYNTPQVQEVIKYNIDLIDRNHKICGNPFIVDEVIKLRDEKIKQNHPTSIYADLIKELPDEVHISEVVEYIRDHSAKKIDLAKEVDEDKAYRYYRSYRYGTTDQLRTYMMANGWEDVGDPVNVILKRVS